MTFFRKLFGLKTPRATAPVAVPRGNFGMMFNPICLLVDGATHFKR